MKRSNKASNPPFCNPAVEATFAAYPDVLATRLLELRALIFTAASALGEIGGLTETLKWRQPAYLPSTPKIGSTIRIDAMRNQPQNYAMYVHCQTTLATTFGQLYPDTFTFEGNRALIFDRDEELPRDALTHCIQMALTYHLKSRLK